MRLGAKTYGKLTTEQFQKVIDSLPGVLALVQETCRYIAEAPSDKFTAVMSGDFGDYCRLYELPLVELLTLTVFALNRHSDVQAFASSSDPQQAVLDSMEGGDGDRPHNEIFQEYEVVVFAYALGRSLLSMARYGRSVSSLLQAAREEDNRDALFKAIRIDRTVIGTRTAMSHISKAQLREDKNFFTRLRSALAGQTDKEWAGLDQMRYALVLLREMGVDDLTEAALEDLMVDKLKVYSAPQGDARKNLRPHYTQSRKIKTI